MAIVFHNGFETHEDPEGFFTPIVSECEPLDFLGSFEDVTAGLKITVERKKDAKGAVAIEMPHVTVIS